MSVKSSGSYDGPAPSNGEVIRYGVLKKMKTSRKKFFVLRAETPDALARLEYYDSEKKFKSGVPPKRCIALKTCFDINKRLDTRYKNVIALYTKDDCFCIVLDNENDLKVWLEDMLRLQHGEEMPEGEVLKPKFDHVWQVNLCARGLGSGMTGNYRLCLTDKTITLVTQDNATRIEVPLASVRSCGNLKNFFFLEVGRSCQLGAGEIWFEADDNVIASNLQSTVSRRFKRIQDNEKLENSTNVDFQPKGRNRSSSDTQSSNKKFNTLASKGGSVLQDGAASENNVTAPVANNNTSTTVFRERCDSMPSRTRVPSESSHSFATWSKAIFQSKLNHSPPTGSPISPPSDSTGSSYSLPDDHDGGQHDASELQRLYTPLTPDQIITEEDCPDSPRANPAEGNYLSMDRESSYMEMVAPSFQTHASNSASMSSVTSGTPSTDTRFSDYPLDKVTAFVSEEDDGRSYRAYSLGSKPAASGQSTTTQDNLRARAFSMGDRSNHSKKYKNRVLHHPTYTVNVKSNSAPILAHNPRMGSSQGSISNPMDDLMEMDFSEPSRSRANTNTSKFMNFIGHLTGGDHNKKTPDGYVEMRPVGRIVSTASDVSPYVDMTQGQRAVYAHPSHANFPMVGHPYSPYVDMSGNNGSNSGNSTPQVVHAHPALANYPMGHPFSPYMDMSGNNGSNNGNSTPVVYGLPPHMEMSANSVNTDYMDMSGSSPAHNSPRQVMNLVEFDAHLADLHGYGNSSQKRHRANSNSSSSRLAASPGSCSSDHSSDYLDMSGKKGRNVRTNSFSLMSVSPQRFTETDRYDSEGLMRMGPAKNTQHHRQSSLDDYMSMSEYMNMQPDSKKERSQPISIQTTSNNQGVKNSSPLSITSLFGRKSSPTSSKMHLPLNSYSSLPRQKSPRKSSSKSNSGSKSNSSTSSSVTTTPSNSNNLMFPLSLNSPSSPAGSSKAGTPTTSSVKVPASVLNVPYKPSNKKKPENEDYEFMDFESNKSSKADTKPTDDSPYVNYCAAGGNAPKAAVTVVSSSNDDYAIMKPGSHPIKSTTLPRTKTSGFTSPLAVHLSSVVISDRPNFGFRPIREKDERVQSPRPGDQVPDGLRDCEKALEEASMDFDDDLGGSVSGSVSPAVKMSRPNSSSSEIIRNRSAGSDKNSRPSSVCSEGLASRLGSNSSMHSSSSSSSTVVGVALKSKLAESDPPNPIRLHYASLDLSPDSDDRRSPRTVKPTDTAILNDANFVYADIDFVKSEELNKSGNNGNNSPTSSATVKN